ncbi:MAG: ADP-ribosylation factor-like protein [Candidatus Hodarchaeales archaeon]|jgi:small GTP-binding protein
MSINNEVEIPDRIKNLISVNDLENSITKQKELLNLPLTRIFGIGKKYARKLKQKAKIASIHDLAKFDTNKASEVGISQKLLEKWAVAASIVYQFALGKETSVLTRRLCIAGLGAVGKSSILKTLQHQKTSPVNLPTMGARIESLRFLGLPITIWDLGGQIGFRKLYLGDPEHYLAKIMILIFVIDTQNNRSDETTQYLTELLIKLKYMKETPQIYLVLHKYDPNIDKSTLDSSITEIINKIDPIFLRYGIKKYKVLRTSIYNVNELVSAFSKVFASISPVSEILSDSLAFYSESHDIMASFLISESGFITAEWTSRLNSDQREEFFYKIMEEIRKETYETQENRESFTIADPVIGYSVNIDRLEFDSVKMFLCIITSKIKTFDKPDMTELSAELRPWIQNFYSMINR